MLYISITVAVDEGGSDPSWGAGEPFALSAASPGATFVVSVFPLDLKTVLQLTNTCYECFQGVRSVQR